MFNNEMLTTFIKRWKKCPNGVPAGFFGVERFGVAAHRLIEYEPVSMSFRPRIST